MDLNKETKHDENDINLNSLIKIFFIAFFIILIGSISYFTFHITFSPLKPNEIGQIGDFYGGLLNPFLTFFTIVFLIWSIRLQSKELQATKKELKRSAESHQELVSQGNANFYIEQAVKSFEIAELKIRKIYDYQIWVTLSQTGEKPPRYIASFFEPSMEAKDGTVLSEWISSNAISFADLPESKRTVYVDKYGKPVIKSLVSSIKQQLICLNALITYKGWIHALSCLPALIENIELLRRFNIPQSNLKYMLHIIDNTKYSIESHVSLQLLIGPKSASVYMTSELNNHLKRLKEVMENNPYD